MIAVPLSRSSLAGCGKTISAHQNFDGLHVCVRRVPLDKVGPEPVEGNRAGQEQNTPGLHSALHRELIVPLGEVSVTPGLAQAGPFLE